MESDYQAVNSKIFNKVINQIDIEFSQSGFVDFGCGKGKGMILAAKIRV